MRTTLSIDPEILSVARQIAAARSISIGQAISELARKGLEAQPKPMSRRGFPVFAVAKNARPLTLEDILKAEDEA